MKKLALVLVALMTLALTGCKTETSTVTVYVEDSMGLPVAQRAVFYADWASIIIGEVLPSPEELIAGGSDVYDYVYTNALGVATIKIPLSVSKLKFQFLVWDNGTKGYKDKTVEIHRGVNEEITFQVQN